MLRETVLLQGGERLTIRLDANLGYTLRYGELIEYVNGRRRVRGQTLPYAFRSVEQLRYDFEEEIRRLEAGA